MQCITFLALAGFCAALTVPCGSTYNFGSQQTANYIACAANILNGGGGSTIITHNGFYCLKITHAFWSYGQFDTHYDLLKGANCGPWQPGDYCYAPPLCACSKDLTQTSQWVFGDPNGLSLQIYQNYINAVASSSSPFNPTMILHNETMIAGWGEQPTKTSRRGAA